MKVANSARFTGREGGYEPPTKQRRQLFCFFEEAYGLQQANRQVEFVRTRGSGYGSLAVRRCVSPR